MQFGGRQEVSLRGSSTKEASRDALLTRAAQERAARSLTRRGVAAAILIQRVWRGRRAAAFASSDIRFQWDARWRELRRQEEEGEAEGDGEEEGESDRKASPLQPAVVISEALVRPLLFLLHRPCGGARWQARGAATWRIEETEGDVERVKAALAVLLRSIECAGPRFNFCALATSGNADHCARWRFQSRRLLALCLAVLSGNFLSTPRSFSYYLNYGMREPSAELRLPAMRLAVALTDGATWKCHVGASSALQQLEKAKAGDAALGLVTWLANGNGGLYSSVGNYFLQSCPVLEVSPKFGPVVNDQEAFLVTATAITMALRPLLLLTPASLAPAGTSADDLPGGTAKAGPEADRPVGGGTSDAPAARSTTSGAARGETAGATGAEAARMAACQLAVHVLTVPKLMHRIHPALLPALRHPSALGPCLEVLSAPFASLALTCKALPHGPHDLSNLSLTDNHQPQLLLEQRRQSPSSRPEGPAPPGCGSVTSAVPRASPSSTGARAGQTGGRQTTAEDEEEEEKEALETMWLASNVVALVSDARARAFVRGVPVAGYVRALLCQLAALQPWAARAATVNWQRRRKKSAAALQGGDAGDSDDDDNDDEERGKGRGAATAIGLARSGQVDAPTASVALSPEIAADLGLAVQRWQVLKLLEAAMEAAPSAATAGASSATPGGSGGAQESSTDGRSVTMGSVGLLLSQLLALLSTSSKAAGGGASVSLLNVLAFTPHVLPSLWQWLQGPLGTLTSAEPEESGASENKQLSSVRAMSGALGSLPPGATSAAGSFPPPGNSLTPGPGHLQSANQLTQAPPVASAASAASVPLEHRQAPPCRPHPRFDRLPAPPNNDSAGTRSHDSDRGGTASATPRSSSSSSTRGGTPNPTPIPAPALIPHPPLTPSSGSGSGSGALRWASRLLGRSSPLSSSPSSPRGSGGNGSSSSSSGSGSANRGSGSGLTQANPPTASSTAPMALSSASCPPAEPFHMFPGESTAASASGLSSLVPTSFFGASSVPAPRQSQAPGQARSVLTGPSQPRQGQREVSVQHTTSQQNPGQTQPTPAPAPAPVTTWNRQQLYQQVPSHVPSADRDAPGGIFLGPLLAPGRAFFGATKGGTDSESESSLAAGGEHQPAEDWNVACVRTGVAGVAAPAGAVLSLFCAAYAHLLLVLDDEEFYDRQVLFSLEQQRRIAATLNTLVYNSLLSPSSSSSAPPLPTPLLEASIRCLRALYERDCRRSFCPPQLWLAPAAASPPPIAAAARAHGAADASGKLGEEVATPGVGAMLNTVPHVLPFEDRVYLFRELVRADKTRNGFNAPAIAGMPGGASPVVEIAVRRNMIVEDGFAQLNRLGPLLKGRINVSFVSELGTAEAGMDYGGLFKEFLTDLATAAFDPRYGLFLQTETEQGLLYPHPGAASLGHGLPMLEFLGRITGKALYEGVLLDHALAPLFVSKLVGRYAYLDELYDLDREMHRNLMYLKHYEGDAADLALDFTVTEEIFGRRQVVELRPGGADISVTNDNKLQYVHAVADYKLNRQMKRVVAAFVRGLTDVIAPSWLRLFNAAEFNQLLSGGDQNVDVDDLRAQTQYSGGYTSSSRSVRLFWEVVAGFSARERCDLLKFVTSCSRGPLLGFRHLAPPFTIHQVACDTSVFAAIGGQDAERLPSASTCFNMLKLPNYKRASTMRDKLKYAISSNAGFELS